MASQCACIQVTKTANTNLSKAGDVVTYTITVCNTGDIPVTRQSVVDTLLGNLTDQFPATLQPGTCAIVNVPYTVQPGDPDPLVNQVTASYSAILTAGDSATVNLFQPSVTVTKLGPALSKVGDEVTYTFVITNTSSADTPTLALVGVTDTLLGDLTATAAANGCLLLTPGASCTFTASYTVQAGDPDPLENTVTVTYRPLGFDNLITDSDTHSVNLFQPSVDVQKGGTALSKTGDPVLYTFTITNTGSPDSPNLILENVTDTLLGDLTAAAVAAGCSNLAPGASCSFSATRTVQAGDPDPLVNAVTVSYHPLGFETNQITDSAVHSVNLFQPAVSVQKGGPAFSKAGDTVVYTFAITNTSSADAPNLILEAVTDTLLGDLSAAATSAGCANLAPGATCNFTASRVVQAGDPDPLENTVTVNYHPLGFTNQLTASDSHSVDLVHPDFTVTKTCQSQVVPAGGTATFLVSITNTGDIPLDIAALDETTGQTFTTQALPPDQTFTFNVTVPVPPVTQCQNNSVSNTVSVTATLPPEFGLSNMIGPKSATASCPVVVLGKTVGFWRSVNGHAILDPDGNGILNVPVTIGGGARTINVTTVAQSDTILANRFCNLPGSNCANRVAGLNQNTLEVLVAQTLALQYNILHLTCYSGQTVGQLGCTTQASAVGLGANTTVNQVLAAANQAIAQTVAGGTTTQAVASAMIALVTCLNRENP